ncbi:MAG: MBL fold metallo-hydrolase [Sedimentisphaerales bacterium]|nr:MBL fold metallo-hydrolase [Sedimentisphaerales bacterium]
MSTVASGKSRPPGVRAISALFISHADIDHYNGVPDLISAIPAQGLYLPGGFYDHATKSDDYFINLPIIRQTRKHYLSSGNLLSANELHIETLWPQPGIQLPTTNDNCLVLRISSPHLSILLCGDITPGVMSALISNNIDLTADYMLLPHHGQYSPELETFVRRVNPQKLILSARKPTPAKLNLLKALPAELIDTCPP